MMAVETGQTDLVAWALTLHDQIMGWAGDVNVNRNFLGFYCVTVA